MQNSKTILVVDDDEKVLELLSEVVSSMRYRALKAKSGKEAIEVAIRNMPDLILLDIMMPGMNGYDVARVLSRNEKTNIIPIVLISALRDVEERVKGLEAGAMDFFSKPLHIPELKTKINSLLKIKTYNDYVRKQQRELEVQVAGRTELLRKAVKFFERFVPREFLECLEKKSIFNISLGDYICTDMTIMFSDIRSFGTLAENMSPRDVFRFLNSYLKRMDPFIWENEGFIDKYIGDAIMALFPKGPQYAVNAAVEMLKYIGIYNQHRHSYSYPPIRIGISIHTGEVVLGTIGHERFMQGTVISDTVNLTSHLQSLSKLYGIDLIVSREVVQNLGMGKFNYRFIDKVRLKGRKEQIDIFEIFDADSPEKFELKSKTRGKFEKGVSEYQDGQVKNAEKIFNELASYCQEDRAVKIYLERCKRSLQERE